MKTYQRKRRHKKVRVRVRGTATRPRLSVYKSNQRMHVQLIDDEAGRTLAAAVSTHQQGTTKVAQAHEAGKIIAAEAKRLKVGLAVFDRGGFLYVGRVRAVAEGAREGGLAF